MFNILTIDVEDYFQVHAFSDVIKYDDWINFECRIERNTDRLLSILNSVPSPQHLKPQHGSTEALNNSVTNSLINSKLNNSALSPQNLKPQHRSRAVLIHSITHSLNNSFTQKVQGTFFVLGWIAERYPDLVRRIQKEGHEIACHGYAHRLVYTQSRDEFRRDVKRAKSILEDITGEEVIGYRAPSYSITNKSQWAFEVLVEEGFKYDSSIFPIRHDFYGMREAPRFPFVVSFKGNDNFEFSMLNFELNTFQNSNLTTDNSKLEISNSLTHSLINSIPNNSKPRSSVLKASHISAPQHSSTAAQLEGVTPNSELRTQHYLIEFPISTVKLLGTNVPISGGGYFRLFPYSLIRKGLKSINEKEDKPFIFYLHPWELDFEQPRIKGVSLKSRFRHYVNLDKTESKFKGLLRDFQFSNIRQLLTQNS
jgi:hypothetical protein